MKPSKKLPKNQQISQLARNLRKQATPEERHLWYDCLKHISPKFHRQIVIGDYIVDFFCSKAKLVIEIDGSQHYSPNGMQADATRTEYLNHLGILVVRFTNTDIQQRFEAVCQRILEIVSERAKSLLPRGEGVAPQ